MILWIFIAIFISFILGFFISWIIMLKESNGTIYLSDDGIYLAMTEKDAKKIEKSSYCVVNVKRKNFSGFNEVK